LYLKTNGNTPKKTFLKVGVAVGGQLGGNVMFYEHYLNAL